MGTNIDSRYGVIVLFLEFWLTVIILVGGGTLMVLDRSLITPIFGLWGVVIVFWFNRRDSKANADNIMAAMNTQPPSATTTQNQPQQPQQITINPPTNNTP